MFLVATYPFALFYGAIYTESLYLLGAVGAFYHFRRRELWAAGAWGLLVGFTRPNGCFLSLPVVIEGSDYNVRALNTRVIARQAFEDLFKI